MQVKKTSPVSAETPFLHAWDTEARKYFEFFEIKKHIAKTDLKNLSSNFFTSWRDPIQLRHRFTEVDLVHGRQLLGDISKSEVKDLNRTRGGLFNYYTKGFNEPAKVLCWNPVALLTFLGAGSAVGLYGKFARGHNILWYPASVLPFAFAMLVNYYQQP